MSRHRQPRRADRCVSRLVFPTLLVVLIGAATARAGGADTATASSDLIFQDDFESGDLSRWSHASNDGGGLFVSLAAGLGHTANGMQAVVTGTTGQYVEDFTPAGETRYRARFYFDPNGFDPGEAWGHFRNRLFILFDEAGTRRLGALVVKRQAGEYSLMLRCRRDDNTQVDTGFFPVTDAPHWVIVDWRRATTATSDDGLCSLTIDGKVVITLPAVQNNARPLGRVRLGTMGVKAGATGTVFLDEFVSRRTGEIPPNP